MRVGAASLVAGHRVRYLDAGDGHPIVLLHAFPLSADQFIPELRQPPPGVRLIAADFRGFRGISAASESSSPLGDLTVDDYAADTLALMDALDLERAAVAGVSMGGYVAFAVWRRAGGRVSRLVLVNTRATPDSPEQREGRDRMIALAHREGAGGVAREMLPKLVGLTTQREQPHDVAAVRALIEANPVDALVAALGALTTRPDSMPTLATITCPVTIVHGEEDAIIGRHEAEAMQRGIAASRLVVVPKVGHIGRGLLQAAFSAG